MSEIDLFETNRDQRRARANYRLIVGAFLLVLAAGIGIFFVFRFADTERERDLQNWQAHLAVVVESRLEASSGWLEAQFHHVEELADNTALKLYMTELTLADGDIGDITDEPAQRTYLRNLIVATAERAGFTGPMLGAEVNANVARSGVAGVSLIDKQGRTLVSTRGMPFTEALRDQLLDAAPTGRHMIDIFSGPGGDATLGFVLPVYMLQMENDPSALIGYIVAIKRAAPELYNTLRQPGNTLETAEALLVRPAASAVEYLSPRRDDMAPLTGGMPSETPMLAAAFAINSPGGFGEYQDYAGNQVLAVSRAVPGTNWSLMYKVDGAEALAEADSRRQRTIITFVLIIAVVVVALVAVWFQASSRRSSDAANALSGLARRFESQQRFLRLVTDSQPNEIGIVDEQSIYRFANRRLADAGGITQDDLIGKTLAAMVGPIDAKRIDRLNRQALDDEETVLNVHRAEEDGSVTVVQSQHIPLAEGLGMPRGVLMVTEDITAAVTEREKRERIMRNLVNTLVTVVDARDPYAAHHSTRVAEVAAAIADEMALDPVTVETVEIAGSLMNLGKILVPEELLTADRDLTKEERALIRNSILLSADLLENVAFEGPVGNTLRQMLENVDGSGAPAGLSGDGILNTARICAVSNAFVGMVSRRAYREGMEMEKAIDTLMSEVGSRFDRGVVAALVSLLDNKGGRGRWEHFRTDKPSAVPAQIQ